MAISMYEIERLLKYIKTEGDKAISFPNETVGLLWFEEFEFQFWEDLYETPRENWDLDHVRFIAFRVLDSGFADHNYWYEEANLEYPADVEQFYLENMYECDESSLYLLPDEPFETFGDMAFFKVTCLLQNHVWSDNEALRCLVNKIS